MIQAKVIADSKSPVGHRLTSMVVTFPRFILAEFNTHRMLSRNSASSRAIPFAKMMDSALQNPFIPIAFQKDHKGMQGFEYVTDPKEIEKRERIWLQSRTDMVTRAQDLYNLGTTKQICNRLLEPFMYHTVIVTASEWENFFALRCPKYEFEVMGKTHKYRSWNDMLIHTREMANSDKYEYQIDIDIRKLTSPIDKIKFNNGAAEIHMMALAEAMWDAYNQSTPKELLYGEWHIPFGDNIEASKLISTGHDDIYDDNKKELDHDLFDAARVKIATARCARVSYTLFGQDGKENSYEDDIKLHDNLSKQGHWSPFEHCARVMTTEEYMSHINGYVQIQQAGRHLKVYEVENGDHDGWSGNIRGFMQYRKTFKNENLTQKISNHE